MKCKLQVAAVVLVLLASVSASLLAQTTAGDELNLGVQAYRQSKYDEAIRHFEKCVALAPGNTVAHLYLATAYAQEYISGADTPENNRMAEQAIDQYQHVLDGNPVSSARINSAKGIAYLYLQMKNFDDSKKYYRMASDLDPNDPEPYYSVAVIDWTQTYVPRQEQRAKLGMRPEDSLPAKDKKVCAEMKEQNTVNVQEGIDNLTKALQLRPDYDDAMAYMNLMYRERADIQCDDPAARSADLKTADDWVDKTMATKKTKAKKAERSTEPAATNPQ
ncbi:MAG TPA: tetratricopeptide repeat protein [Terriglobales bacterium]|nr:tetratricopeptide repeat protein [Terriglobales bacterium]